MSIVSRRSRTICIVVGEESGDLLGAELILALKGRLGTTSPIAASAASV